LETERKEFVQVLKLSETAEAVIIMTHIS